MHVAALSQLLATNQSSYQMYSLPHTKYSIPWQATIRYMQWFISYLLELFKLLTHFEATHKFRDSFVTKVVIFKAGEGDILRQQEHQTMAIHTIVIVENWLKLISTFQLMLCGMRNSVMTFWGLCENSSTGFNQKRISYMYDLPIVNAHLPSPPCK